MRYVALCLLICLVFEAVRIAAAVDASRVHTTIYSADNCAPCVRYITAVKAELPKRGLIVRDDSAADVATADVIVTKKRLAGVDSFPTTILRRNGREVQRISGETTPAKLIEAINGN